MEYPKGDSTAEFCHFCNIKKYEFDLEFIIEKIESIDNPQKHPLHTIGSVRRGRTVDYHVFNRGENTAQTQGDLFWATKFYLVLETPYEPVRYGDFEKGWLCFRKHSSAAPVKYTKSEA
jgi:hypothetical protein